MHYPKRTDLILPEYGRNIQQMITYAISIPDKEERTRCAKTIIGVMGNLFPHLRDIDEFKRMQWDHLAIMSNFKLDIDYPYDVLTQEKIDTKPEKVPYQSSKIRYMHYGRLLQKMIAKAIKMDDGEYRDAFVIAIANHMKKQFLTWNKETVDDTKIQQDLTELSNGQLAFNAQSLIASKDVLNRKKNKNKNKKNKNKKNNR